MLFTEGADRVFERMMCEKPRFHNRAYKKDKVIRYGKNARDCPYCLYYDLKIKKCKKNICVVFDE